MAIQQGTYDIEIYRGDSKVIELNFIDVDNNTGAETPTNLSTVNVSAQVRYSEDSPDTWLDLQPAIADAAKGLIRITINASKSAGTVSPSTTGAPSVGTWDLQFQSKTDASQVFTPITGKFIVRKDVTRP